MLVWVVVAILNLELKSSELGSFIAGTRVSSTENRFFSLIIEQVDLDGVVSINVLISEKEFLLENNEISFIQAMLRKRLVGAEPFD